MQNYANQQQVSSVIARYFKWRFRRRNLSAYKYWKDRFDQRLIPNKLRSQADCNYAGRVTCKIRHQCIMNEANREVC